jgi:hypothetical protein
VSQGKQFGRPLDLVDDNEALHPFERTLRLLHQDQIARILQIEPVLGSEGPVQGRFAALPGTQNRRDGKNLQQLPDLLPLLPSFNPGRMVCKEPLKLQGATMVF